MLRFVTVIAALALLGACASEPTDSERSALEEEFERSMRNVRLEGHFTVAGEAEPRLRPERYEIERVERVAGNLWTVHARIQYGDHDVAAPVPVNLLWAGDTPVITLTDVGIPGLGTFTARVAFYRDRYAGMWWHGETGGNQFGRIVRPE